VKSARRRPRWGRGITGDDELARPANFRAALRLRKERYLLDVLCKTTVRAQRERRIETEERLVLIRPMGESRVDYTLTKAGAEVPLAEPVRAHHQRHHRTLA
jgi:hypothetical protein